MSDSPLMTVQEAAEFYRVSAGTIRDWVHAGKLAHVPVGKRYRIVRPDLPTQGTVEATTRMGLPVTHEGTRITNRLAQAGYLTPED
jgi:excisionase family DNA binding protein